MSRKEEPKWTLEQRDLFNEIRRRLGKDGDIRLTIESEIQTFRLAHPQYDIMFPSAHPYCKWTGLDARVLHVEVDQRRVQRVIFDRVIGGYAPIMFEELDELSVWVYEKILVPFHLKSPSAVREIEVDKVMKVTYPMTPVFTDPFWNLTQIPMLPRR